LHLDGSLGTIAAMLFKFDGKRWMRGVRPLLWLIGLGLWSGPMALAEVVAVDRAEQIGVSLAAPVPLAPDPAAGAAPEQPSVTLDPDISPLAPGRSLRPVAREPWALPPMRWDDRARGARWSLAVMGALRSHGAPLMDVVPRDIDRWCPAYRTADRAQRAAFWAGLVSTLAWHESTFRPRAVGGGGRWFGLVQIAPGTARYRQCAVRSGQALLDGPANLRCGIRIMAITVPRDGVVSEGMRGVAADWGPFHSRRKREDMRNWVSAQPYCMLPARSLRPVPRPAASGDLTLEAETAPRPDPRPATDETL
jgi:hypothetical protein